MVSVKTVRHISRILFSILPIFVVTSVALAQGSVGSTRGLPSTGGGGSSTIKGRVYFPVRPESMRVRVRLSSSDLLNESTVADEDGIFIFNRIPAGHYTIIVEGGDQFDTATEQVDIDREASPGGRNMNITITLKLKGSAAALGKVPKPARELYTKGTDAANKGDNKGAVEFFNQAIKLYPQFPQAMSELGIAYMKLNKFDKAAETYEELLKLGPGDATVHMNYGIALNNLGIALQTEGKGEEGAKQLVQSEAQLREAIKLNNSNPAAHYYLAVTLIKLKHYDEATAELETSIKRGGDNIALAHKYLGGLYMNDGSKKKAAADELEKYLQLDPKARDADRIKESIKKLRNN
ncbi:MAG TPA: tetratricopeptide repeat protein [Pyrinomonadaceae bacterium]|nr:tetratricopeptide repeat protein [Pyrinomonadaceae bacterium]